MPYIGKSTRSSLPNQITNNSNKTVKHNAVYIGYVKDNSDALMMNRLKVWIPELSSDPINGVYTVNWCSPFAGATPVNGNNKTNNSQTSYGMWFSPPDINNEVVVLFVNGDPARGIYIGGLYQQDMNHMVPGIPSATMTETDSKIGDTGPTQEYNKKNNSISSKDTGQERPTYNALKEALVNQGLGTDDLRGTSTSGARRGSVSNVAGILTQGGNQFVMDDDENSTFIRLRTPNGCQIVINDTVGMIYMITKSGNSWLEISDDGIDSYTTGDYNVRCHGDYNIHADGNINLCSGKYTNIASFEGISISAEQSINVIAANKISVGAGGELSMITTADLNLSGNGNVGIDCGESMALRACSEIGLTSCDSIDAKASKINLNSNTPVTPKSASQPDVKQYTETTDRTVSSGGNGQTTTTKTIVSILPTHEPYAGHPTTNSGAATVTPNSTITAATKSSETDTKTDTSSTSTTTNNEKWIYPVTGTVSKTFATTKNYVAIKAPYGQSVISTRKGKVVWAGQSLPGSAYDKGGIGVVIDHYDGTYTISCGLSSTAVTKSSTVIQGQTIGKVGKTDDVSELLFEVTKKGVPQDASMYLTSLGIAGIDIVAGKN